MTDEIQSQSDVAAAPIESTAVVVKRAERKVRIGIVVSNKMQKTVVVRVERSVRHPMYGRTVNRMRNFKAHDENNDCGVGDRVEIAETRPLSREKRWRVAKIVERAK